MDWRTPTYGRDANTFHRCLIDAIHVLLRRAGLSVAETKAAKFALRRELLRFAQTDVVASLQVSSADRRLVLRTAQMVAHTVGTTLKVVTENGEWNGYCTIFHNEF